MQVWILGLGRPLGCVEVLEVFGLMHCLGIPEKNGQFNNRAEINSRGDRRRVSGYRHVKDTSMSVVVVKVAI